MSSAIAFDAMVEQMVSLGVPRERALAVARAEHGIPDARTAEQLEADEARDEKRVVAACDKQLRALGFRVINTSQPRHAKYITPGVPDRIYFHRARGVALCWEAKCASGVQKPAQRDFQEDCDACGWIYLVGTDQVVYDWLVAHGIAFEEGGLLVPLAYRSPEPRSA